MTRALWLFTLLAAILVAGARCLIALPVVDLTGEEPGRGVAVSQGSQAPADQAPAAPSTVIRTTESIPSQCPRRCRSSSRRRRSSNLAGSVFCVSSPRYNATLKASSGHRVSGVRRGLI